MCGILGFIAANNSEYQLSEVKAKKYLRLLKSRGPDSTNEKYIVNNKFNLFLGHTRLSIQDTSSSYDQPYSSEDSRNQLIYNGEIYNYRNFPKFKNYTSDTKALYEILSWDKDNLNKLDGIFAFCFWDNERKLLYLARDRFGVKPLFIYIKDNFLAFCSSLRVLEKLLNENLKLNLDWTKDTLLFGYSHDNCTVYKGINKLASNSILKLDTSSWTISSKNIYVNDFTNCNSTKSFSIKKLKSKLCKSIVDQISTSDRGFGFFLSGGTDSSLLVAETLKINDINNKISTFSLLVPGKDTDESSNINLFRSIIGDKNKIKYNQSSFSLNELRNALDLYPFLDYPVLDLSILPMIVLCKSVDKGIRVILSGDGADELFCGYPRIYTSLFRYKLIYLIPDFIKNFILNYIPISNRLKKYINAKNPLEIREILMGIDDETNISYPQIYGSNKYILKSILDYEVSFYLPSVLEKVDAASMLSSLEVRVPFLSNNIVDYVKEISIGNLLWQPTTKYHLKRLLANLTSNKYAFSQKKGFGFNTPKQIEFVINYLSDMKYPCLLNKEMEKKFTTNPTNHMRLLLLKHWLFGYDENSNSI